MLSGTSQKIYPLSTTQDPTDTDYLIQKNKKLSCLQTDPRNAAADPMVSGCAALCADMYGILNFDLVALCYAVCSMES